MSDQVIRSLKDICIKQAAQHSFTYEQLHKLPLKDQNQVIDQISLDYPLEVVGTYVNKEEYWKRRALQRWKTCEAVQHGGSWKQLFFEKNVVEVLEGYDGDTQQLDGIKRLLSFSKKYVKQLHLRQLPSHLDLEVILGALENSCSVLSIIYSIRDIGMEFDNQLFGMKLSDCRSLARALEKTETLVYLILQNNQLDDDKVRMIASGLVDNLSVLALDLSHNKVGDRGVKALSKLIDLQSVLQILILADNQIQVEGGKAIARALRFSNTLIYVNLHFNRIDDQGGMVIFEVMKENTKLQKLDISINNLGEKSAQSLCGLLKENSTLQELDVSCNKFPERFGPDVMKAIKENRGLKIFKAVKCGLNQLDEDDIQTIMTQRCEYDIKENILQAYNKLI